jgi:hypothetical protein
MNGAIYAAASATNSLGTGYNQTGSIESGSISQTAFQISASSMAGINGGNTSGTVTVSFNETLTITSATLPVGSYAPIEIDDTITGNAGASASVPGMDTGSVSGSSSTGSLHCTYSTIDDPTQNMYGFGYLGALGPNGDTFAGGSAAAGNGIQSQTVGGPVNWTNKNPLNFAQVGDTIDVSLTMEAQTGATTLASENSSDSNAASGTVDVTGQISYYTTDPDVTFELASSSWVPGPSALPVLAGGLSCVGLAVRKRRSRKA